MSRLISVDVLISKAEAEAMGMAEPYHSTFDVMVKWLVAKIPTFESEQKVGKWIKIDDGRISGRCSECGWEAHLYEDDVYGMDYCPNCGMRLEVAG